MATILVKDALRGAIEAASGGAQTVLYTPKGQPTFVNIIPKKTIQELYPDLGINGTHPAFKIGDKEISQLYIGTYQGRIVNGELLSLPNVDASVTNVPSEYWNAVKAIGPTWHLMTNIEWSLIQMLCIAGNFAPYGSNGAGWTTGRNDLFGRRIDGRQPGDTTAGTTRIYTGSGPIEYRHNGDYNGISDLAGNAFERSPGARIVPGGELQVYGAGNEASAASGISPFLPTTSSQDGWFAIDATTGTLITPTFSGTLAGGDYVPTTPNSVRAKSTPTGLASNEIYKGQWEGTIVQPTSTLSDSVKSILELYAIWPSRKATALSRPGSTFAYNPGTTTAGAPARARTDVFQMGFANYMSTANTDMCVRPVYYAPLA